MKKLFACVLVALLAVSFVFANGAQEEQAAADPNDFHVGIVTGTVSQSEDDLRGAEALIAEYGAVKDGRMEEDSRPGVGGQAPYPLWRCCLL